MPQTKNPFMLAGHDDLAATLRRVQGTLGLEGMTLTPADEALITRALTGEISEDEFRRLALEEAARHASKR